MLDDLTSLPTGKPEIVKPEVEKDKRRYTIIPFRAIQDKKLTHRQLIALMIVCSYTDRQGNFWPGVYRLAKDMGVSQQTMTAHIQKLTEKGYLKTINGKYKPGEKAKKRAVIYDVDNPPIEENWREQQEEKEAKSEQLIESKPAVQPEPLQKQDLQAVFKVWKAAVNKRFPEAPVTYNETDLKLIARHPLEEVKKIAPQALKACRVAPSSCRLLIRYLEK